MSLSPLEAHSDDFVARLAILDLTQDEISCLTQEDPILQSLSWKEVYEEGYFYEPIELDQKLVEALAKTNEGCTY